MDTTIVRFDVDSVKPGDEIRIPAWWRKGAQTLCRVSSVGTYTTSDGARSVAVQPLEGNPHSRFVLVYPPLGPCGQLGGMTGVAQGGKFLGAFESTDEALRFICLRMEVHLLADGGGGADLPHLVDFRPREFLAD